MQVARLRSGIVSPVSGRGAHAKPLLAARQGRNPSASAAGNLWHPKKRVKAIIENFVRIPVKIVYSLSPIQFLVVLPRDAHGFRLFGSGFQTTYSKQTRFEPARSAQNRFDATRLEHARFERAPRASAYRVRAD